MDGGVLYGTFHSASFHMMLSFRESVGQILFWSYWRWWYFEKDRISTISKVILSFCPHLCVEVRG